MFLYERLSSGMLKAFAWWLQRQLPKHMTLPQLRFGHGLEYGGGSVQSLTCCYVPK
jgi:hypothetical protein